MHSLYKKTFDSFFYNCSNFFIFIDNGGGKKDSIIATTPTPTNQNEPILKRYRKT